MVEVKRIKAPSDLPAKGSYVLVLYGPSAMDREHPRGRTLMVREWQAGQGDEFAAAVETAKTLRKPTISRPSLKNACEASKFSCDELNAAWAN